MEGVEERMEDGSVARHYMGGEKRVGGARAMGEAGCNLTLPGSGVTGQTDHLNTSIHTHKI